MDLTPIIQTISKTESIAVLVLIVVCASLFRTLITIRREDRADRKEQEERAHAMQTRNNTILEKLSETITELRVTLATRGIRDDR